MYKIYCYTENAVKLFNYTSDVIPMIGDCYSNPCGIDGNYDVTRRLLHTASNWQSVMYLFQITNVPLLAYYTLETTQFN